jgi:predicted dehydrogenase
MGRDLISQAKSLSDIAEVVAVCDIDAALAKKTAFELGSEAMTSSAELIARDDVNALFVATPGYLHAEPVLAAAGAGKHVFVEKPMALRVEDCQAMIDAADSNGVKLMVGQVLRYTDVFQFARDHIAAGDLGEVFAARITRTGSGWGSWGRSWRTKKEQSGGVLFEFSVHELDFMRCCLGDAESVYAVESHRVHHDLDYADTCFLTIRFRSGGLGQLAAGLADHVGTYRGEILGTDGAIHFDKSAGSVRYRFGDQETQSMDINALETPSAVNREVREFIEAVGGDGAVTIPGKEGMAVVEIASGAGVSAQTGEVVPLTVKTR